jgi:Ca2+-binding RTX toxin-like protein
VFTPADVRVFEPDRHDRREEEMRDRRTKRALGVVLVLAFGSVGVTAAGVLAGTGCTIPGTSGDDVLRGTDGPDVICGRGGDDILRGKGGDDVLRGGPGDDTLDGDSGDDRLLGGDGIDFMSGGRGTDVARGGKGDDFSGVTSAGDDQWFGGAGADHLTDFKGIDAVVGGRGKDACLATADRSGGDSLLGGPGFDTGEGDSADDVRGLENEQVCFAD